MNAKIWTKQITDVWSPEFQNYEDCACSFSANNISFTLLNHYDI